MRVSLDIDGGDTYFPGLQKPPISIETDRLAPPEAAELRRLVASSQFFERADVPSPAPGAAGFYTYTIAVQDDERHRAIAFSDGAGDDSLRRLRDFVRAASGAR